ncbi:TIGR03088 family PEP-CTERM/XrtA system glycosyltransferase [Denitromonas iodatirespirans]|uniref:TIGR03088 family PEP-CTERM/XrtA system glycosyltransferase n=1 Tax=Denitromonas iodatirespirans TaxID=2795389 RepID=A0A944H6X4_DENI1|nr:TIGR03088 family PEP-CTERM/XrtA system glycosyltransferase [Denitromonas iodatirespirans]MBT0960608.1 TIGR03088 family PEP-CTERM/XrtA system glycosyltransferase [Denitromonas iodatirespirans]
MTGAHVPLVAHVVHGFRIGGLENGVVNLINRMPASRYRHVVIALTDCDPAFCRRVTREDVDFISLRLPPGHGLRHYRQVYRLLRQLRPDIVHTRNLAALEMVVPAWAAGVPVRIHGEHGWDTGDPGGASRKYRLLRRLYAPFVTQYIALSRQLSSYLQQGVGIAEHRISRICNGVDAVRFAPAADRQMLAPAGFCPAQGVVFGTVGRLQTVKDQLTLVRAFGRWLADDADAAARARLVIVGDGPQRGEVEAEIAAAGVQDQVWLAGARDDVPALLQSMDVFVLPSKAEGISNTLLEAMASGLPVIATEVGGNGELVQAERTGLLVPPEDPAAMAGAMRALFHDPARRSAQRLAARARIEAEFSLDAMVAGYMAVYDRMLTRAGRAVAVSA